MPLLRFAVGFVAGLWLYHTSVVLVGGFIAAFPTPKAYFSLFGRQNLEVAHAVLNLLTFTVPITLIVAGGALAAHRLIGSVGAPSWVPLLAGMLTCFALWTLVPALPSAGAVDSPSPSPLEALRLALVFPWWAASNFLAPWLGLALAAWLTKPRASPPSYGEA